MEPLLSGGVPVDGVPAAELLPWPTVSTSNRHRGEVVGSETIARLDPFRRGSAPASAWPSGCSPKPGSAAGTPGKSLELLFVQIKRGAAPWSLPESGPRGDRCTNRYIGQVSELRPPPSPSGRRGPAAGSRRSSPTPSGWRCGTIWPVRGLAARRLWRMKCTARGSSAWPGCGSRSKRATSSASSATRIALVECADSVPSADLRGPTSATRPGSRAAWDRGAPGGVRPVGHVVVGDPATTTVGEPIPNRRGSDQAAHLLAVHPSQATWR